MRVGEYLEKISAAYVPGVVAYYDRLDPSPWQQAHDDFQEALKISDWEYRRHAAKTFSEKCIDLINRFKREGRRQQEISNSDAFHLGPAHLAAKQSAKYRECYNCRSKEKLGLESYGPENLQVRVVCSSCKGKS